MGEEVNGIVVQAKRTEHKQQEHTSLKSEKEKPVTIPGDIST